MPTIAHIINPVKVQQTSDLFVAQPITFESMLNAKRRSEYETNISLLSTCYEEDKEVEPIGFEHLPKLNRSVLDLNAELSLRKLPLIADIIQQAYKNATADYIIYTNVDIGLMPYFYDYIYNALKKGHDAIVINRRRLSKKYNSVKQLPEIYADIGKSHPGFDCFVFKRELAEKFELGHICVGIPFIGVSLAHNLFCLASNPLYVPDAHLTFHIGEKVMVRNKNAFYDHNRSEFEGKVYPALKDSFDISKFPYQGLPLYEKALKWMLNPSLFTKNFVNAEQKGLRAKLDEIRWRILQK